MISFFIKIHLDLSYNNNITHQSILVISQMLKTKLTKQRLNYCVMFSMRQ